MGGAGGVGEEVHVGEFSLFLACCGQHETGVEAVGADENHTLVGGDGGGGDALHLRSVVGVEGIVGAHVLGNDGGEGSREGADGASRLYTFNIGVLRCDFRERHVVGIGGFFYQDGGSVVGVEEGWCYSAK